MFSERQPARFLAAEVRQLGGGAGGDAAYYWLGWFQVVRANRFGGRHLSASERRAKVSSYVFAFDEQVPGGLTPRAGAGELLLAAVAVRQCGTDIEIYDGTLAYYRAGIARYPVVPGREWVADVVEVGKDVEGSSEAIVSSANAASAVGDVWICREGCVSMTATADSESG